MKLKAILATAIFAVTTTLAIAESYYAITITDFAGRKEFDCVSGTELKEIQAEIKMKNKLLPVILREIQKDWEKNPDEHQGETFYGRKLKPMTIKTKQGANSEKAQATADKWQEREDNKELEEKMSKKGKKLSDREKEKAYEKARKEGEIRVFADEVMRLIEERIEANAAAK